jgi:3-oxoacyl-(acyl-carrier-protein) synthase
VSTGVVATGSGLAEGAGLDALLESRLSPHMLRRTDRLSQMIVTAAILAAERARWTAGDGLCSGVVVGTGLGCLQRTDEYLDGIVRHGVAHADALTFPDTVDNAPAAHVGLVLGCRGPSLTVGQHEISGECAVVLGALLLRRGLADAVIVAAGDVASPRLRDALRRMAPRLSPGDGAAALLLERAGDAARRGAPVLGRLLGHGHAAMPARGGRTRVAPPALVREAVAAAHRMADPESGAEDAAGGEASGETAPSSPWLMADGVLRSVRALDRLSGGDAKTVVVARGARGGTAAALLFGAAGTAGD